MKRRVDGEGTWGGEGLLLKIFYSSRQVGGRSELGVDAGSASYGRRMSSRSFNG
jgi:hypothetical protein